jgi:nucleotide-binding universal stress UspA family protein
METQFANITVPVDHSETAARGIAYAIALARNGAVLHFCSVVDTAAAGLGGAIGTPFDPLPFIEAAEEQARSACSDAVSKAQASGVTADGKILHGPIVAAINRHAKQTHSDAIVIGTHARRGLSRVIFGSIAEGLLAQASVPVFVTHADDAVRTDGPVSIAVDGSAPSRAALMFGIELARAWNVSLAIENVTGTDREDWQEATEILDASADEARAANIDFELVTVAGRSAETIVDGAERRKSSAIVVGSGAHSATMRFLLGSVATAVLERARLPVVVVPQG